MKRFLTCSFAFIVWCFAILHLNAADDYYFGGIAALSTLSGDGRSIVSSDSSRVSQYKPENGPAVNIFFGRYLGNYVSLQANYLWNSNDVTFVTTNVAPGGTSFYQESRSSSQTSVVGDVLVFFRERHSLIRPYLSAGGGLVHLASSQQTLDNISGLPVLPPHNFSNNVAGLRVAVGMDVRLGRGFSFRYSFSETISPNPLSDQLSPPGQRPLKNFQNLGGFIKTF